MENSKRLILGAGVLMALLGGWVGIVPTMALIGALAIGQPFSGLLLTIVIAADCICAIGVLIIVVSALEA